MQWKAEAYVRLPTWLRLGVRIIGTGILGTYINIDLDLFQVYFFILNNTIKKD